MAKIHLIRDIYAIIDDEDLERVSKYNWYANWCENTQSYYAITEPMFNYSRKRIHMHRLILDAPDGFVVDHINHDTLDNRKANLRVCTPRQNSMNSRKPRNNKSGYKGVYWNKQKSGWQAQICINNKTKYLGRYKNKQDAIIARRQAEIKYFAEYRYRDPNSS